MIPVACREWLGTDELVVTVAPDGPGLALWPPEVYRRFCAEAFGTCRALNSDEARLETRVVGVSATVRMEARTGRIRLPELHATWLCTGGAQVAIVPRRRQGFLEVLTLEGLEQALSDPGP